MLYDFYIASSILCAQLPCMYLYQPEPPKLQSLPPHLHPKLGHHSLLLTL